MTPLQFAREECANHQPDGSCLGVMIGAAPFRQRCDPEPKCLLSGGQRCRYFEECVAPMADIVSDPRHATALQQAVAEYHRVTKQGEALVRQCPECGGPMRKGKQYCPLCADKRRKESNRTAQSKKRQQPVSQSAEVSKNASKTPTKEGHFLAFHCNGMEDSHHPQNGQTFADIKASTPFKENAHECS